MSRKVDLFSEKHSLVGDVTGRTFLISLFPHSSLFKQAIDSIPDALWRMGEPKLEELIKPSVADDVLKINFWTTIEWATKAGVKAVDLKRVFDGVMIYDTFRDRFMKSPYRMAWLCKPVIRYEAMLRATHARLQKSLMKVAYMRIEDDKGVVDPKKARLVLEVFKTLDERLHGQAIQRALIEKREVKDSDQPLLTPSMVEAEIQKLERKLSDGRNDVIELEVEASSNE